MDFDEGLQRTLDWYLANRTDAAQMAVYRKWSSQAMKEHGAEVMGDVPNYTSVSPILLTGDVVVSN